MKVSRLLDLEYMQVTLDVYHLYVRKFGYSIST